MKSTIIKTVAHNIRKGFSKILGNPTARVIATQELADAQRYLLLNQSKAEYYTQMNVFYRNTITRLEKYLKEDV